MNNIEKMNIPIAYKNQIKDFYDYLMNNYKDNMLLFTLSGSTVFENIIEGISDIDFILVLKTCTPKIYEDIYTYKNSFEIKIGGLIIVEQELINKQIDYVSMYYLYLINIGYINPIYISENYKNDITKDDMLLSIKNVLILNVRTLKKIIYSRKSQDSKYILKNIVFVAKDYLILLDIYCKSLNEVINTFNKKFHLNFDIDILKCLKMNLMIQK